MDMKKEPGGVRLRVVTSVGETTMSEESVKNDTAAAIMAADADLRKGRLTEAEYIRALTNTGMSMDDARQRATQAPEWKLDQAITARTQAIGWSAIMITVKETQWG